MSLNSEINKLKFLLNSGISIFLQNTPNSIYQTKKEQKKTNNNNISNISNIENLAELELFIRNSNVCALKNSATQAVFADGNPFSRIMLIGEAPGADEDKFGKPFVGRAGKLLDKMLEAIQLNRTKVYISNVVNYRPPSNRRPTESEILRYLPYLKKHIEIINPKIVMLLGSTALNALIGNKEVISRARGRWIQKDIGSVKPWIIASFHPAFLMRQPDQKKMAWIDLKMIRDKSQILKI